MTITNDTEKAANDENGHVDDQIDSAARPTRRTFSVDEVLAHLADYDSVEWGAKGEIDRRAGAYSSQLNEWRHARDAGLLGPKGRVNASHDAREIERLNNESRKLKGFTRPERFRVFAQRVEVVDFAAERNGQGCTTGNSGSSTEPRRRVENNE
jgi:hypothetical protein